MLYCTPMKPWSNFPTNTTKESSLQLPLKSEQKNSFLVSGEYRSYGDSCLSSSTQFNLTGHDNFLSLDETAGLIKVQAGIRLFEILKYIIPKSLFLPVTPGTQYISVGGAVANDVHGKNHVLDGCFGNHITQIGLYKSDGSYHVLSPTQNVDLFKATIGGLGLTGIIDWVEFKLKKITTTNISQESIKFKNLSEFLKIAEDSKDYLYTVAWVDCLAKGNSLGRGTFMRGNHSSSSNILEEPSEPKFSIPFSFPNFVLNKASMWGFNQAYYNKQLQRSISCEVSYKSFFYPLDSILKWNNIYGKRGFLQYQFVLPFESGEDCLTEIFQKISKSGMGSFLAVLKTFGNIESPGMMSFPKEGITLALDFPNHGKELFSLLNELDELIISKQGRIYPAKDARMSSDTFKKSFPMFNDFIKHKDPKINSLFWNRVMENK